MKKKWIFAAIASYSHTSWGPRERGLHLSIFTFVGAQTEGRMDKHSEFHHNLPLFNERGITRELLNGHAILRLLGKLR